MAIMPLSSSIERVAVIGAGPGGLAAAKYVVIEVYLPREQKLTNTQIFKC
jgi:predicted NAD/FAD-binding protein